MSKRFVGLVCLLGLMLLIVMPAAAKTPDFHALAPGEAVVFTQTVPINLVFIGYDAPDQDALLDTLPASYEPVVRFPIFYGQPAKPIGLRFDFTYRTVDAGAAFEDRFFGYLASHGRPGALTRFQQQYNDQQRNLLDITGPGRSWASTEGLPSPSSIAYNRVPWFGSAMRPCLDPPQRGKRGGAHAPTYRRLTSMYPIAGPRRTTTSFHSLSCLHRRPIPHRYSLWRRPLILNSGELGEFSWKGLLPLQTSPLFG